MHDSIGSNRGLVTALGTLIPSGTVQRITMPMAANRADKAVRSLDIVQILSTGLFVWKTLEKLCKAHGFLDGFACCVLLVHNGTTFTVPLSHLSSPIYWTYTTSRPRLF